MRPCDSHMIAFLILCASKNREKASLKHKFISEQSGEPVQLYSIHSALDYLHIVAPKQKKFNTRSFIRPQEIIPLE